MFNFNSKKINYKQKLGSGVSATVYPYQKDPEDKRWVVKRIVTDEVKKVIGHVNEIVLAFNCDNRHVLPVKGYHIGYNEDQNLWEIYIKLQRMKCSLKTVIDQHKKTKEMIKEDSIIRYFYEATKGLQYLHARNIAHRDIKPDNLLLDADDALKVADFGEGNLVDMEASYIADKAGSVLYAAPENKDQNIKIKKTDLFKSDYWSLGMVVLELCTLDVKFLDVNSTGMQKQADVGNKIQELRGKYSDTLLDLILEMLQSEPSKRRELRDIQEVIEANYAQVINMEKQRKSIQVKIESSESGQRINMEKQTKNIQVNMEKSEAREMKKLKDIIKYLENSITGLKLIEKEKEFGNKNEIIEEVKLEERKSDISGIESMDEKKAIVSKRRDLNESKPMAPEDEIKDFISQFKRKFGDSCAIREMQDSGVEVVWKRSNISNREMDEMACQIALNLKSIRHLSLSFCYSEKMTVQGMKDVASQIAINLKNLQHLSLSFPSYNINITDQGMKDVASQIAINLKNLQHLSLSFSGYNNKTTDQGMKDVASQIAINLKNLQHLSLSFSGANNITDQGMKDVASQIAINLKNLQHLSLSFSGGNNNITDQGIKETASQVRLNSPSQMSFILNGTSF